MPRVHKRVARKDYPQSGIKKGDTYYTTRLKLQWGGMTKRSLTPFKPSELTNSPFKSGWLAAGEAFDAADQSSPSALKEALEAAAEAIRDVGNEAQGAFDNMPEGLQQGSTGEMLENRASECEAKADELDDLANRADDLEEPEPYEAFDPADWAEEISQMDPEDVGEFLAEKEREKPNEYEESVSSYESELEDLASEAEGLLSDMPE